MESGEFLQKNKLLNELKKLAKENCVKRLDEEFLRRFLVGRQYDVFAALKAVQNFESFIERRKQKWLKLEKSKLRQIFEAQIVDVLDSNGIQDQKVAWIRIEKWDPQMFTADEILEVSGLLCEMAYSLNKEIKHIDIIVDLNNFSLKHLYGLSPRFAKRMVFFMSECLPMKMLQVYVVRQSKIFFLVYSLFKPFIEEQMRKMISVCGSDFQIMLANIGSEIVPSELGGSNKILKPSRWIQVLNTKKTQRDLQTAGYHLY